MSLYGPCLVRLGRHADAEPALLEAHRRLVETGQEQTDLTRDVVSSLIEVYQQTGQPSEVAKWTAELPSTAPATQPTTTTAP
jgi:hypothetical protein